MSLPIPFTCFRKSRPNGRVSSRMSNPYGLHSTRPSTSPGRVAARCTAGAPPIDWARTTTIRLRSRIAAVAATTSSNHSVQARPRRSSTLVPWPGRRTPVTDSPCSANHSPIGRIEAGEPVKPWTITIPTGPPSNAKGAQPGRTEGSLTGTERSDRALAPAGVQEERGDEVEEEETDRPGQSNQEQRERPL